MKSFILSILALSLAFSFSGCASTSGVTTADTKLIAQVAVSYAVMKVTDKHPEKAAKILSIAHDVRAIAGTDGFNTVDLLVAAIKAKVDFSKLSPADQMLVGVLIDEIGNQLKARIGTGVLTSDKLLIVGEVAGWVEDAAKIAAVPAG